MARPALFASLSSLTVRSGHSSRSFTSRYERDARPSARAARETRGGRGKKGRAGSSRSLRFPPILGSLCSLRSLRSPRMIETFMNDPFREVKVESSQGERYGPSRLSSFSCRSLTSLSSRLGYAGPKGSARGREDGERRTKRDESRTNEPRAEGP